MSQNLGKLCVSAAFLALAGAVGFYVSAKDTAVKSNALTASPKGEAFDAALPAPLSETALGWLKGEKPDGDFWAYDLFTPVEVSWLPRTSEYMPKGESDVAPKREELFGLRLVSITHPKYRLRVSAIAEGATKAPADATIFVYDDAARVTLRGKVGEVLGPKGNQIKILKYEPRQTDTKTGQLLKAAAVTVKDLALRRDIVLGNTAVEFKDRINMVFCSEASSTPVWTATAVGDKFEDESGVFTIKGVDFEGQTVTVDKSFVADPVKNKRKVISETLSPIPAEPKPEPKK